MGGETRSRGVTCNRSTIRDCHLPTAGELIRHTSISEAGFDADENRSDEEVFASEQRRSSRAAVDPEKGAIRGTEEFEVAGTTKA